MARRKILLEAVQSSISGGGGTVRVPLPGIGLIHEFQIEVKGGVLDASMLSSIQMNAGPQEWWNGGTLTGTNMDEINQYRKMATFSSNVMRLVFDRRLMKLPSSVEMTSLALGVTGADGIKFINGFFTLKIAGATAPDLEFSAIISDNVPAAQGVGVFPRYETKVHGLSTGNNVIDDLFTYGSMKNRFVQTVFMKASANNITNVKVTRGQGGPIIWEATTVEMNRLINDNDSRNLTGYWDYILDWCIADIFDPLDTAGMVNKQDLVFEIDVDGDMNLTVVAEKIVDLNNFLRKPAVLKTNKNPGSPAGL